ncbi:hypothetical protein GLV94_11605 [Virgibacillus halodenitrificans]|uniref:YppG family protein n=1 Tax=Virgibacillus halodenitrificans TaxID=1482 RepID=UPI0013684495|nr:YppG family protein [Virgibacillus halodenitrificans]MYL46288.1 hypothetical protein [Virgibacillus halodenitrificans]
MNYQMNFNPYHRVESPYDYPFPPYTDTQNSQFYPQSPYYGQEFPQSPFDMYAKPQQPPNWPSPMTTAPPNINNASGMSGSTPNMNSASVMPGATSNINGMPGAPPNMNNAPGMQQGNGLLNYFQDNEGQMDLDKMLSTVGQLANTYHQVSPIVKQFGSFIKNFR